MTLLYLLSTVIPLVDPFYDDRLLAPFLFCSRRSSINRPRFRLVSLAVVFLITRKKEEDHWKDDSVEQA